MARSRRPRPGVGALLCLLLLVLSALVLAAGDRLPLRRRAALLPPPAVLGEDIGQDDWLALGPFVAASGASEASGPAADPSELSDAGPGLVEAIDRDWLSGSGGEARASPLAIQRLDGPGWRFVHAEGTTVFLSEHPGTAEEAVVYAFREVEVEGGGAAWLGVRASTAIKVFLNGEAVYARYGASSRYGIEEAVAVRLHGGRNRLLVKVAGLAVRRDFALRLFRPSAASAGSIAAPRAGYDLRLLSRVVGRGGRLRGILPLRGDPVDASPEDALAAAYVPGPGGAEPRVSALDEGGVLLAETAAVRGGVFELALPPGYGGPVLLRASDGRGETAVRRAYAGDLEAAAAAAALSARAALSSLPPSAPLSGNPGAAAQGSAGYDRRATLAFLAGILEGKAGPRFRSLDDTLCALEELDSLLGAGDGPLPRGRVFRLARTSLVDGSLQPWCLALPAASALASGRAPSLLVALHDLGESDLEAMERVASLAAKGVVVLAPYGRGDSGWAGLGEEDLEEAQAAAENAALAAGLPLPDRRRSCFVGWGWGASAALREAQFHPASIAAVAAFSGLPGPDEAASFLGLPVLLVRGEGDGGLSAEEARDAVARLEAAGARLEYETVAGRDPREVWEAWGGGSPGRLFRFLSAQVLPWPPARIELRSASPRHGTAPGLRLLESIDPARFAALRLERLDERHLALSLENVSAFELDPGALGLASSGRIVVRVEERSWACDAGTPQRFALEGEPGPDGRGSYEMLPPEEGTPEFEAAGTAGWPQAPQLGCGFGDLFRSPLLIVYGTGKPGRTALLKSLAEGLADWAPTAERPFGSSPGRFPVIADSEATASVLAGHSLLLVGGPGENRLAETYARNLPIAFLPRGFSVQGNDWKAAGLALLYPRPDEAGRLLGLIAPPAGAVAASRVVDSILAPLHADPVASSFDTSYRTPDLMIFDASGKRLWAASFDAGWSRLRSWYE